MRRSSSTSRRCGASSAGRTGVRAWQRAARSLLVLIDGGKDRLEHLVRIVAVDHCAQEALDGLGILRRHLGERPGNARGLEAGELLHQRLALRCRKQQALAAIIVASLLHDIALVQELLEHAAERLLGDAQDVEEVGDLEPGIAIDKVHDAMMGAAEAERLQLLVGIADEIAIGEEQQFDDIPAQIASVVCGRPRPGSVLRRSREIYVRHIDVSWFQCYKTISLHETLDRFASGGASKQGGQRRPDRQRRPEQIYRAIVERHFGKTYWTSVFRKSM